MTTKKVIYIVAAALGAVILMGGIATVAVMADGGPQGGPGAPGGKLLDRVAQILNIDRQKLVDAFKQAGSEMRQDAASSRFDKLVADGKLTQDQANQYKAWLAARPAGMPFIFMGAQNLDKALADGKITQDQYNAIKAWLAQKPAFELPKPERPAGGRLHRGPAGNAG
jgi:hypothetical protein